MYSLPCSNLALQPQTGQSPLSPPLLTAHPHLQLHGLKQLPLGPRIGIRDMARVTGGILILAGPIADQVGPATVFRWNEVTNELRDLGLLVEPSNRKAESLIVLDEDPEFYNILVMYDDIANGGPTQYNIPL